MIRWAALGVSLLGLEVTAFALPLSAALVLGATQLRMGLLATASQPPFLLLSLPAGARVNRRRRRPLLTASDLGRLALLLSVPVAAALGVLGFGQLCLVGRVRKLVGPDSTDGRRRPQGGRDSGVSRPTPGGYDASRSGRYFAVAQRKEHAMRGLGVLVLLAAVLVAGVALGRGAGTSAQDATPAAMAEHPLVGAWVVDSSAEDPSDAPAVAVISADGSLIDTEGVAGTWRATGPRTASSTFVIVSDDGAGSVVIRGSFEVDEAGETWTQPYSFTVVAADGTVLASGRDTARARRIPVEPVEAEGTPLAAVPTWTPATPEAGTPEAASPEA